MWNRIKSKLKSPVVWGEIIVQIAYILTVVCSENISNEFKAIATPLVTIFTLFGVLNNPDDKANF